jgi:uncharacterized membrane protein
MMTIGLFLALARLIALVALVGIVYVGATTLHFSPAAYIAAIVVWLLVFGALFPKAP